MGRSKIIWGSIAVAIAVAAIVLPTFHPVMGCVRAAAWPDGLIALHAVSDAAIAVAYAWIPIELVRVQRARNDIPVDWVVLCFAGFIVLCGLGHALAVLTIWRPLYWLSGEIKAATAIISLVTAGLLTAVVAPELRRIPSSQELKTAKETAEREAANAHTAREALALANAALAAANAELAARAGSSEERAGLLQTENVGLAAHATELEAALAKLRMQELAIQELSTPVLELRAGVLLVPLVGVLDSHRAQQLMETVGDAIRARRARSVLLDLTGVPVIDTAVAASIAQTASMIRLLGAEVIATGLRPAVARTIVGIGVELSIPTKGSLSQGLEALGGG